MQQDFTVERIRPPGVPLIPKFRMSYNSGGQTSPYFVPNSRRKMLAENTERANRTGLSANRTEITAVNKTLGFDCKQNLSPIILEQKHPGMLNLDYSSPSRRPLTSYDPLHDYIKELRSMRFESTQGKKMDSFDVGHSKIDTFCSKMTQSIIFSSRTLDPLQDAQPPLSNDQFERLKFLGQGKFGQVHLVKHKVTGFVCALKVINKRVVREEKVEGQIAKQLRIQSRLKSLNIIDFYGFFTDELSFYILLEYATEGSVFSKLKGKTRLEQEQILPIAKGICDGLRFIHRMGYVHRDIKPQNIVLQFGIPKICDFGWATDCDNVSLCKSYCGTPLYISPEMVRKQFYGTSIDIWATGLVVYELLVGRVPFSIWNEQDMQQILVKSIQFPSYIDRSPNCESFIRKCLEKESFKRMEVSQALRHPFLNQSKKQTETQHNYDLFQAVNDLFRSSY